MELSELLLKEGVFYETQRVIDSTKIGSIGSKEVPVRAVPVGLPRLLRMPTEKSHTVGEEVIKMEDIPENANAYIFGDVGKVYVEGGFPVGIQFYQVIR